MAGERTRSNTTKKSLHYMGPGLFQLIAFSVKELHFSANINRLIDSINRLINAMTRIINGLNRLING